MRFCRDNKIFFFVPVAVTLRNIGGGGGGGELGCHLLYLEILVYWTFFALKFVQYLD
jgi:hypothetical protein